LNFTKNPMPAASRTISIGSGDKAVTVGGETSYPFYQFEGEMPNKPKDCHGSLGHGTGRLAEAACWRPFKDVVSDPVAWAKKCVDEFGAEMIVLQLKSIDPNDEDASPAKRPQPLKKFWAPLMCR
jgi:acetyl-CoA decarbonylase/synthase complex subunit delta